MSVKPSTLIGGRFILNTHPADLNPGCIQRYPWAEATAHDVFDRGRETRRPL